MPLQILPRKLTQPAAIEARLVPRMDDAGRKVLEAVHCAQICRNVAVRQLVQQRAVVNGITREQHPAFRLPQTEAPRRMSRKVQVFVVVVFLVVFFFFFFFLGW